MGLGNGIVLVLVQTNNGPEGDVPAAAGNGGAETVATAPHRRPNPCGAPCARTAGIRG